MKRDVLQRQRDGLTAGIMLVSPQRVTIVGDAKCDQDYVDEPAPVQPTVGVDAITVMGRVVDDASAWIGLIRNVSDHFRKTLVAQAGGAQSSELAPEGVVAAIMRFEPCIVARRNGNCSRGWQKKSCAETRDLIHPTDVDRTWHWAE